MGEGVSGGGVREIVGEEQEASGERGDRRQGLRLLLGERRIRLGVQHHAVGVVHEPAPPPASPGHSSESAVQATKENKKTTKKKKTAPALPVLRVLLVSARTHAAAAHCWRLHGASGDQTQCSPFADQQIKHGGWHEADESVAGDACGW